MMIVLNVFTLKIYFWIKMFIFALIWLREMPHVHCNTVQAQCANLESEKNWT